MGPRILIIRRDNIGDLVCTTPLLRALREQLPEARIDALVTRYNVAVLADNPDLDRLYAYQKAKHRETGESRLSIYWERVKLMTRLRREGYDWALLPGGAPGSAGRFARIARPKEMVIRDDGDQAAGPHEVEQVCHLLPRMGLEYRTPGLRLVAPMAERQALAARLPAGEGPRIGLHISARKPSQRWPAERFAELARRLHQHFGATLLLFWAPGASDNALHPGDDAKARAIVETTAGVPLVPLPSRRLPELIAGLDLCQAVICADGGAMHLAAALGKPIVALFGRSDPAHWRPWGVPQRVLQKPSQEVAEIAVEEVLEAFGELFPEGWATLPDPRET